MLNITNDKKHNKAPYFYQSLKPLTLACLDPLHLLKRSRYRFLQNFLSLQLKLNNNYLNSDVIKDNCDFLAENVFDMSPIMKMRDDVALRLFSGDTVNTIIALHN